MRTKAPVQAKPKGMAGASFTAAPTGLVQRKCACGGSAGLTGECADCRRKRMFGRLQTKLAVNAPGDLFEQEAYRVADHLMRLSGPSLQQRVDEEEEEGLLQTKPLVQRRAADGLGGSEVPPIAHDILRSPGQPLDPTTRAFMEPRFGHDFSQVRVHTDAKAAESARVVNALAYAVGRDVVFGTAQYAPETIEGRRLLAHELAHVVQQAGGRGTVPLTGGRLQRQVDPERCRTQRRECHDCCERLHPWWKPWEWSLRRDCKRMCDSCFNQCLRDGTFPCICKS